MLLFSYLLSDFSFCFVDSVLFGLDLSDMVDWVLPISSLTNLLTYLLAYFSRQLSAFSLCFSGLVSAFLVLSTICLFMKVSLCIVSRR